MTVSRVPTANIGFHCMTLLPGLYDIYVYDRDSNGHIENEGIAAIREQVIISAVNIIQQSFSTTFSPIPIPSSAIIGITSNNVGLTVTGEVYYTPVVNIMLCLYSSGSTCSTKNPKFQTYSYPFYVT